MIKFRGIPLEDVSSIDGVNFDGKFVYGDYAKNGDGALIIGDVLEAEEDAFWPSWWVPVDPKTIGQFTGLTDVNGKDIYEGDIVRILSINVISDIKYMRDGVTPEFEIDRHKVFDEDNVLGTATCESDVEIIGNVHANPELLKGLF
ncbi:YopX family protein [Lactiplantibacillus plantarum]|uniref:YopX family protein n=1 Tax=Lactiplantibacillus plantarum TaxID=1590 RepID=UPI003C26BB84